MGLGSRVKPYNRKYKTLQVSGVRGKLKGHLRVPVTIVDDDSICSCQSDALSSCPCRQQEHKAVCLICTDRQTDTLVSGHTQLLSKNHCALRMCAFTEVACTWLTSEACQD